jgi:predicted NBD/HSP70 family sugar kinase
MQYTNGKNAKLIKIHNRTLVLRIIQQHENISRKAIAGLAGLTQAAITNITQYLLNQGLIVEQEIESPKASSGRKPIGLVINKAKYKILSLYLGRFCLEGAIFDLAGNLLSKHVCQPGILTTDNDMLIKNLIAYIHELIASEHLDVQQILGIGIAAPGPINAEHGVLRGMSEERKARVGQRYLVPFDWSNVPLKAALQKEFGVRVFVDNNANVAALAESWFGQGIGVNNLVLYSIGMGIGAGVIIDGMLYRGEDDVVAEIGHITADLNGPQCICGNIGCLELYASFAQAVPEYRELTKDRLIAGGTGAEPVQTMLDQVEKLFQAAYAGDPVAMAVIKKRTKFLGIGAVSLANLFSPECIVIAPNDMGDVDLNLLIEDLQESVRARAFSVIADKVRIVQSQLKHNIHLYGGLALVLQDFFQTFPTHADEMS